ncbi:MAG: Mov34/MPN/PAD-1 family protein [Labilithrix sp.]|nr:Mov34/MPN/PAD-1 family protein [Labilithrix sp.]
MRSNLREVIFLIGRGDVVLWSDASESPVRLPDSRARWEAIWSRRDQIVELAHSHPIGPVAFSREDETTMRALVTALGREVLFSVIAPDGMVRRVEPLGELDASEDRSARTVEDEPWWARLLRLASGMQIRTEDLARGVAAPDEIASKEQ